MRYEDALAHLSPLPSILPAGPAVLDPRVVGRQRALPDWARPGPDREPREAAVLVLVYPGPGREAHLVLTRRPDGDLAHAGQISLPGGKREPGDDFPVGTALREASEEVGLDAAAVGLRVLGSLEAVLVRASGFLLAPVLAVADHEPVLRPDPSEVAGLLLVPVRHFLPQAHIELVEDRQAGWSLRYGAFPVGGHRVWGATARILGQLGSILGDDRSGSG